MPAGTTLCLLGPNGAGKTTAVRMLATLLRPDTGWARVAGHDVVRDSAEVRRNIGVAGQYASLDECLTGRANLIMLGELSRLRHREAKRRAAELLAQFGLEPAAGRPVVPTPAACGAAWTWPPACWPGPGCCSSTSRPPGWTPGAGRTCGGTSGNWSQRAARSCSPLSTWRRPTSSPTGSASWTAAPSPPREPRPSSRREWAPRSCGSPSPARPRWPTPPRCWPATRPGRCAGCPGRLPGGPGGAAGRTGQ